MKEGYGRESGGREKEEVVWIRSKGYEKEGEGEERREGTLRATHHFSYYRCCVDFRMCGERDMEMMSLPQ